MQYKRERTMFVKYNINIAITQPDYCCFRVLLKSMTVYVYGSRLANVTIHIILLY